MNKLLDIKDIKDIQENILVEEDIYHILTYHKQISFGIHDDIHSKISFHIHITYPLSYSY
jgi:hypothetical protein